MQPYFFPYIGYWQLIHSVDRFVIYDDVHYIRKGWVNRNRILNFGKSIYITAPLQNASPNKLICDISLQPPSVWHDKLVKMTAFTYRRAPYFAKVFPVVEQVIRYESCNLSDYLAHQLQTLAIHLGINTEFVLTSRCYGNSDLSGLERGLDICKREGMNIYINAPGGQALYNKAVFAQRGLELKFLIPKPVPYKQFGTTYVPWLSIIDVMMFNSQSQLRLLLNQYELV